MSLKRKCSYEEGNSRKVQKVDFSIQVSLEEVGGIRFLRQYLPVLPFPVRLQILEFVLFMNTSLVKLHCNATLWKLSHE